MITRLSELKLQDIRGVIFDLDGTLAHSNPDFAGLRRELGIHSGTDILAYVESLSTDEARAKALDIIHEYERQSSLNASWIDGARELIECLRAKSLPLAILTRNMPEAAQITIDKLGIDIELVLTRSLSRIPKVFILFASSGNSRPQRSCMWAIICLICKLRAMRVAAAHYIALKPFPIMPTTPIYSLLATIALSKRGLWVTKHYLGL